jgi:transglutaminase-like putative cysteine protease
VATRQTADQPPLAAALMSRAGLMWATVAFAAGALLNIDRVPPWVPVAALVCVGWRLMAMRRRIYLPGTVVRSVLALLLVAGVLVRFRTLNGLSAGTALLTLMGAIKLLETRAQRDQYIVLGAALFLLLAACLDRQGLLRAPLYLLHVWLCCAALAAVAYAPAARSPERAADFDNRAAMVLAARSLLFALPLALVLFVFFPRLPGSFWAIPRTDTAITGLGDTMSPGSISRLTQSYDVVFRARFDTPLPPPHERYWRGPVLHDFDGFTWRRTPNSFVRQDPLQYLGIEYRYHISLEPSAQRWWFSLDTATGAPGPRVFFTYDYQLISAEPITQTTDYALVSHTSTRATENLSPLARKHDTALPADRNPRSRELALKLRRAAASDAAYVDSVLAYLRTGGFQYSLEPPRLDTDSVDDFLFNTRLGFCGHYASAFVSLMRAAGVPARIVTGYLGGEWNAVGRYFIVRQSDAHSWAEVWLEGRGWARIDPTAVVAPDRLDRGILDLLPNAVSAPARFIWSRPWLAAALQRWDALNSWWTERVVKFNYDDQLKILERLGFDSPGARELAWIFASALIAWLLLVAWRIGRTPAKPRPDRLARAYSRLGRKLAHAGVAREIHQGPLAYADEVSRRRPDLDRVVRSVIERYAQLRYGNPARESIETDLSGFEREVARLKVCAAPESARAPEMRRQ